MYKLTYATPNESVDPSTQARLNLVMQINLSGYDTTLSAHEHGVCVADWGELEWRYDLEDALMVPGQYTVVLGDASGELRDLFLSKTTAGAASNKQAFVELFFNDVSEFSGYIIEDKIFYNHAKQQLTITVMPKMDILNNTKLYDDDGNFLNPCNFPTTGVTSVQNYLNLIYRLVNPDFHYLTNWLDWSHDWKFKGIRFEPDHIEFDQIYLSECQLSWQPYFSNNETSVADILKTFAQNFCSFTGMIKQDRAFFKKLFCFNASNVQTMGEVLDHTSKYIMQLLDYVEISQTLDGYTTKPYRGVATAANINGKNLKKKIIFGFWDNGSGPATTNMNAYVNRTSLQDGHYGLESVSDPSVDSGAYNVSVPDLVAGFWYNFRHYIDRMLVEELIFDGLQYQFSKDFYFGGSKCQPIRLKKRIAHGISEIDAINLGAA